jgi:hypothetical protein
MTLYRHEFTLPYRFNVYKHRTKHRKNIAQKNKKNKKKQKQKTKPLWFFFQQP